MEIVSPRRRNNPSSIGSSQVDLFRSTMKPSVDILVKHGAGFESEGFAFVQEPSNRPESSAHTCPTILAIGSIGIHGLPIENLKNLHGTRLGWFPNLQSFYQFDNLANPDPVPECLRSRDWRTISYLNAFQRLRPKRNLFLMNLIILYLAQVELQTKPPCWFRGVFLGIRRQSFGSDADEFFMEDGDVLQALEWCSLQNRLWTADYQDGVLLQFIRCKMLSRFGFLNNSWAAYEEGVYFCTPSSFMISFQSLKQKTHRRHRRSCLAIRNKFLGSLLPGKLVLHYICETLDSGRSGWKTKKVSTISCKFPNSFTD